MSLEEPQKANDSPQSAAASTPASDSNLTEKADSTPSEDLALALLENRDLAQPELERILGSAAIKSRKVRVALASHPRAPRRIALRLIRELHTFDLVRFSLLPAAAADLKRVADELLVARLASITLGEKISLARRSSGMVAGALLLDKESCVWLLALENPRLTEAGVIKALRRPQAALPFVEAVCRHTKWSLRPEIRIALLRNAHTPLARALEFARRLSPAHLRDILRNSKLPQKTRSYLLRESQGGEK